MSTITFVAIGLAVAATLVCLVTHRLVARNFLDVRGSRRKVLFDALGFYAYGLHLELLDCADWGDDQAIANWRARLRDCIALRKEIAAKSGWPRGVGDEIDEAMLREVRA